jgi:transposase-like protein
MTTLDVVSPRKKAEPSAEEAAALELVRMAKEQGLSLTRPDGLLKQITKSVLETALNEEMTEHLRHEKTVSPGSVTRPTSATAPAPRRCSPRPPDTSRSTSRGTGRAFLDYDLEIRTVICSTNAIESLNARYRRAIRARGHFPTEQSALKCLYLVTRSLDPTGRVRARWTMRWKPALNAFAITFAERWPAAETY